MSVRRKISKILGRLEKNYATNNLIEVSKQAILHNLDLFKKISNKPAIPVLKGNAYGHGIKIVAAALKHRKLPYIAVDGYFEALRIREVSNQPILIMGAIAPENFANIKYKKFAFVVHDTKTIRALGKTNKRLKVHLEINTGMNRHGAKPSEITALTKLILGYKNLTLEGIMSHLADSDGNDPSTVNEAVKQFDNCVEAILAIGAKPTIFHVAQSAGSLKAKSKYANAFRLGIGLYGVNPFPQNHKLHAQLKGLRPALKLTSTVTKIINLKAGDEVSYNYTFTAPKNMRIGVLPLGYYEGVNRALSNCGVVKVGKRYAPIVGRVCMNHTMINLDNRRARVGDRVVVYSDNSTDNNSIENIAHEHNLFTYDLLTSLSHDVRRRLVD